MQAGLIALCVASTAYASSGYKTHRTRHVTHHRTSAVHVVDVAASPLPPPPPVPFERVKVVNSADRPIHHHGLRGFVERAHREHMRVRAAIYRTLFGH
jgi:hypothetical protein